MKKLALISVANRKNIYDFVTDLLKLDYQIISTQGTYQYLLDQLSKNNYKVCSNSLIEVSNYTKEQELFSKRIKTLHTKIYAGILAQRPGDPNYHPDDLQKANSMFIDLVVVNFPPISSYLNSDHLPSQPQLTLDQRLSLLAKSTDIGGPCMLRAAAKNARHVIALCDPKDYQTISIKLTNYSLSLEDRLLLSAKAYNYTQSYDQAILSYLSNPSRDHSTFPDISLSSEIKPLEVNNDHQITTNLNTLIGSISREFGKDTTDQKKPTNDQSTKENANTNYKNLLTLKYGENPHQKAFYIKSDKNPLKLKVINNKALSYNNYLDIDQGVKLLREFSCLYIDNVDHNKTSPDLTNHIISIYKHTNVCCATFFQSLCDINPSSSELSSILEKLYQGDSRSAFGGVMVTSLKVDEVFANLIKDKFFEVMVSPFFSQQAIEILAKKPRQKQVQFNTQALTDTSSSSLASSKFNVKSILGDDLLVQQDDRQAVTKHNDSWKVVSNASPSDQQLTDMLFAAKIVKNLKSNAIAICCDQTLLSFGCGNTSRIDSCEQAKKALKEKKLPANYSDLVMASDGFFPFRDVIDLAASFGIKAIIAPKGSKNDQLVIDATNQHNIALVFSSKRYFLH